MPTTRPRLHLPVWLQLALALGSIGVVAYLVWPQLSAGEQAFQTVRQLSIPLTALAVLLEAASLAAYSMVTWLLVARRQIRYPTVVRVDLSALGLSHATPAGGATSAALRLRLLVESGLRSADTLTGVAVEATAVNLVLGCVFLLGIALSIVLGGDPRSYLVVSAVVVVGLGLALLAGWLLVRHDSTLLRWGDALARRFRWAPLAGLAALVGSLRLRIRDVVDHPSRTSRVLVWSSLNWLLDALVLWVMLAAAGVYLPPGPLLIVYGLGNLIAIVPLTPGGLGVVEGVMISALVGFGVPGSVALVGVIGWRLWEFWMPLPVGAIAYLSIKLGGLRRTRRTRRARGEPGERGADS